MKETQRNNAAVINNIKSAIKRIKLLSGPDAIETPTINFLYTRKREIKIARPKEIVHIAPDTLE